MCGTGLCTWTCTTQALSVTACTPVQDLRMRPCGPARTCQSMRRVPVSCYLPSSQCHAEGLPYHKPIPLAHASASAHTNRSHLCKGRFWRGSFRSLGFKWWEVVGGWERYRSPSWLTVGDFSLESRTSSLGFPTPTLKTHRNFLNPPNPAPLGM